jgi:hypothetical protein
VLRKIIAPSVKCVTRASIKVRREELFASTASRELLPALLVTTTPVTNVQKENINQIQLEALALLPLITV